MLRLPRTAITAAPLDSGTAAQVLFPASNGGIALPDPMLLAAPSFLASLADTLPTLLYDTLLGPYLANPALWPSSPSITLTAAAAAFAEIAPLLAADSPSLSTNPLHPTIRVLLTAPDGSVSPALLPAVAGRRSQHVFTAAVFSRALAALLSPDAALSVTARARIRHAAAPLAHLLFTTYYIPATSELSNIQTQFLVCHRLGIPLPFVSPPPPLHCHPRCPHYPPPTPIPVGHYLHNLAAHLLHHLACGAGGHRHRRHDAIVKLIAAIAQSLLSADVNTSDRLCSSSTSGTKVDIVITSHHRAPYVTALDVTVSCPLLPSHVAAAAASAEALFTARAAEKNAKHLPGCIDLDRFFLPVVFTTLLGIGPRESREYLDSLFSPLYVAELTAGGTGHEAHHRRLLFLQSLQASAVRATAHMAVALSQPPPPPAP